MRHVKHHHRMHDLLCDLFEHTNHEELEPNNYPEVAILPTGETVRPRDIIMRVRHQMYLAAEALARCKFLIEARQTHFGHFSTEHDTREDVVKRTPAVKVDRAAGRDPLPAADSPAPGPLTAQESAPRESTPRAKPER